MSEMGKIRKAVLWWGIGWDGLTSFVDVVGENSGGADQYTGYSTGTAHEHQYEDYKLRHMRLVKIILRRLRDVWLTHLHQHLLYQQSFGQHRVKPVQHQSP
jgi:hypothetical protein